MDLLTPCPAPQAERLCDDLLAWGTRYLPPLATAERGQPSLVRGHITYTIGADGVGYLPVEAWRKGRVDSHSLTPLLSENDAADLMRAEVLDSQHAALAWLQHLRAGRDALAPLCARFLEAVPYLQTPRTRVVLFLHTGIFRVAFQAPGSPIGLPGIPGLDIKTHHRVDSAPMDEAHPATLPFSMPFPRLVQKLSAFSSR